MKQSMNQNPDASLPGSLITDVLTLIKDTIDNTALPQASTKGVTRVEMDENCLLPPFNFDIVAPSYNQTWKINHHLTSTAPNPQNHHGLHLMAVSVAD
jgi:hypothetical protein